MAKKIITVSVAAGDLSAAIAWAAKGVNRNPTSPSEGTVSLILEDNSLTLKAFDGSGYFEFTISAARPASDDGQNTSVAIHGPTLISATKVLRTGDVRLEFDKDKVVLRTGRSHFSLPTLTIGKIKMPTVAKSVGTVTVEEIKQAVSQVEGAAAKDETLAGLTGILVEFHPDKSTMRLVACDRYQLAVRDIDYSPVEGAFETVEDAEGDAEEEETKKEAKEGEPALKVLVPAKDFKKMTSGVDAGSILEIHADGTSAFFGLSAPSQSGYVNVFSEQYVAYQRLMQASYPNRMVVSRTELKGALADIGVMIGGHEAVYLHIHDGIIRVHNAADDSEVEIDADIEGNDSEINEDFGFSKEYLNGVVNAATSDKVAFSFIKSGRPAVVREVDDEEKDESHWMHLIMPRNK